MKLWIDLCQRSATSLKNEWIGRFEQGAGGSCRDEAV